MSLYHLFYSAQVVDFAKPTGPNGTHPLIFQWIKNYFRTGKPCLMDDLSAKKIQIENMPSMSHERTAVADEDKDYPPLYFQHEGIPFKELWVTACTVDTAANEQMKFLSKLLY